MMRVGSSEQLLDNYHDVFWIWRTTPFPLPVSRRIGILLVIFQSRFLHLLDKQQVSNLREE